MDNLERLNYQLCADAGSEYCPCHLAYSGDCIKCSLIRGQKVCNCMWQGVCIYNEVEHSKNSPMNERKEYLCSVYEKEELSKNLYLLKMQVPKFMIRDLCAPGAYVLLKGKEKKQDMFNSPISVMDVDLENSCIEVIIRTEGIKTKSVIGHDEVWVKGPYFNGVFGIKDIKTTSNSNCVVVLNGLSQVNSINIIKNLLRNSNTVRVFINNQAVILDNVIDKVTNLGVKINPINMDLDEEREFLRDYLNREDVKLVYSSGCNGFNRLVMNTVDSVSEDIKLVISNNNLICCGEGVCGACTILLDGEQVKSCKSQVDSRKILKASIL